MFQNWRDSDLPDISILKHVRAFWIYWNCLREACRTDARHWSMCFLQLFFTHFANSLSLRLGKLCSI